MDLHLYLYKCTTALSSTQSTLQYLPHSPTHIHTLKSEAAMQGAYCISGAIWGSVSCSGHFDMQPSSAQHGGTRNQTSNLPITRQTALPAELQPAQ